MMRIFWGLLFALNAGYAFAQSSFGLKNVYHGDPLTVAELRARAPLLSNCQNSAVTAICWGIVPLGSNKSTMTVMLREGSVVYIDAQISTKAFGQISEALRDEYGEGQALPDSRDRVWVKDGVMMNLTEHHRKQAGISLLAIGRPGVLIEMAAARGRANQGQSSRPSDILR